MRTFPTVLKEGDHLHILQVRKRIPNRIHVGMVLESLGKRVKIWISGLDIQVWIPYLMDEEYRFHVGSSTLIATLDAKHPLLEKTKREASTKKVKQLVRLLGEQLNTLPLDQLEQVEKALSNSLIDQHLYDISSAGRTVSQAV